MLSQLDDAGVEAAIDAMSLLVLRNGDTVINMGARVRRFLVLCGAVLTVCACLRACARVCVLCIVARGHGQPADDY